MTPAEYGQQLLEQYRKRDGVAYRPSIPAALDVLPMLEEEARERMVAGGEARQQGMERIPHPENGTGPARDQAAAILNTNGRYVSDAKRLQREAPDLPTRVKTYPTLNLAFYEASAAVGRVLYLLQAMDGDGRGWHQLADVRERLTGDGSPWKVYTWRRLRQILNEGEGWAWHRDNQGRIWLHSPARIARALEIERLQGRPVYIPVKGLLKGIKRVRAHFYASWESGRREAAPVSRQKLEEVTGVPERTQRAYDAHLGRGREKNIAISNLEWTAENRQELAWKQHQAGRARPLMPFVDWMGKQYGERGAAYIAYQIPDTRTRCHATAPKGRLRKHNQAINLVNSGTRGHDGGIVRIYHLSAEDAGNAYGRRSDHVHYWPQTEAGGDVALWGAMH